MPDSETLTVHVEAVKYEVSIFPQDHPARRHFKIELHHRRGRWAVVDGDACLGADGTWAEGVEPYGRGEDWLTSHRFDFDTAKRLATEAAPRLVRNGLSATKILAEDDE
ncbi:hypothetical protein ABZ569_32735 [Streptomyces albus]|uniref:hypothetical protein n=1 Tax=Streptomyces albus TaxID=1888 RepID=UPI0033E9A07B